jgi:hypothetical protein
VVVVVDQRELGGGLPDGVRFVCGDIAHRQTWSALALGRARGVILLTGGDLVNIEASAAMRSAYPRLATRVVAHVADIGMLRMIEARVDGVGRVFNAHQIAVRALVEGRMLGYFTDTAAPDVLVLAGFGRFGQTVLETVQRLAPGEVGRIVVVDLHGDRRLRQFKEQVGLDPQITLQVVNADLDDPDAWVAVLAACDEVGVPLVVVVGSPDEGLNLRTAIWLRGKQPAARIVVRTWEESNLTRQLGGAADLHVFGVADLLRDALAGRIGQWFGPSDSSAA